MSAPTFSAKDSLATNLYTLLLAQVGAGATAAVPAAAPNQIEPSDVLLAKVLFNFFQGGGVNWAYVAAPATAVSPGVAGNFSYDARYLYVCVALNTWVRVGLASW